ncbi:MAG: 2-succinyl-5-enolpyruvyl-6-hydroxy-3-cyclohexene-1-carboxylic-acid synthase [Actinobacteria bacterium]|nr:2-succinyl-5-enolpyruvyl-6-hydroxy-3-cyclohexene-1-carboxylic-acid synthase [Actinomycetota bacterium]
MSAADEAAVVQATFAATVVDEWARAGVRHAVVAPGSRSAPLALALAADDRLHVHVRLDERSAGFLALGIAKASGLPAVVLTTSGTAAVELHPAVVEASHAGVPLVVCTADRPPELQGVGAPQSIDQTHLYGRAVRWFCQPGPAESAAAPTWRSTASRAVAEALGPPPGPVHLNVAFREPLVADAGPLPPGRAEGAPWHRRAEVDHPVGDGLDAVAELVGGRRGLVVAGAGAGDPAAVHELAAALAWPVLADPSSGARLPRPATVAAFDAVLRHRPFAEHHRPEVVVRLGAPPASRVLAEWLAGAGATEVLVDPDRSWLDPGRGAALSVVAAPGPWCRALAAAGAVPADPAWSQSWAGAEAAAQLAIGGALERHPGLSEPGTARVLSEALAPGSTLVVSSSMPVRDLEWYGASRTGLRVLANRGANGIDGVVSTAAGVAIATAGPTALLVGDLAFLYDVNGLLGLAASGLDLTMVVVDNAGGGIFSLLPQAELLAPERFEQLFGTPQGVDVAAVAGAYGIPATAVGHADDLRTALAQRGGGVRALVVRTDRSANAELHRRIHAEVAASLGAT